MRKCIAVEHKPHLIELIKATKSYNINEEKKITDVVAFFVSCYHKYRLTKETYDLYLHYKITNGKLTVSLNKTKDNFVAKDKSELLKFLRDNMK